ncbi:Zn(2)-C6 fungal-type domain-containing protein [Favolaschia claudopus]|uniref:Zn(2)-C6 fungal-type domain-containing protein n=1 Tax=Favolaschia claudopus TaxID=2862362 RepID=A0AAW0DAT2_9AGAR
MASKNRVRAPYATQACTVCRSKKSKCDGTKPVCGSCAASGRGDECSWGRNVPTKKPRTEAHFEALRKRANSLQVYVELLEDLLSKCICQDVSSHLQSRPQRPEDQSGEEGGETDTDAPDSDEEITQELTIPTKRLKLGDPNDDPLLYGAYFRVDYEPETQPPRKESSEHTAQTYVLQLEGVDVADTHPAIDWSRYLPPDVVLERKEHDKVLDLAFHFHTMFPIVTSLFLRDMYQALSVPPEDDLPRLTYYSPMLHNAILAISLVFSDDPNLQDPKTRLQFVRAAQARFDFKKPDASMVHALAFIATFYTDIGDRIPAELYFGMSTRLVITLGLGNDASEWVKAGVITHDEMVGRNWTYWSIFILDVIWALYWGRDFTGPPRRNALMPYIDSNLDQMSWFHSSAKMGPQADYTTLILYETSALSIIATQITDTISKLRPPTRLNAIQIVEQITKIDLELNNWKSRLPPEIDMNQASKASCTPQRLMLHLAYWWCFVVLHRPFFHRRAHLIQHSDPEVDHVKLCVRAAENILELTETWSSLYPLRYAEMKVAGVVFTAATVFMLRALHATASSRIAHSVLNIALAQVHTCIRLLREMGETWISSARSAELLQAILDEKLKPVIDRRLALKGDQLLPVTRDPRQYEVPPMQAHPGGEVLAAGDPPSGEWVSSRDTAVGWSELPLDEDFMVQMQVTSDPSSYRGTSSYYHEFDSNGYLFSNLPDSFRAAEQYAV